METTLTTDLTEAFETETCGRCGGGGHYSYCQSYGTTCFKCRGKGKVYTKRALAALDYGKTLRTIKVKEVKVGMLIFEQPLMGGKTGWFTVTTSAMTDQFCTSTRDGVDVVSYYWHLETTQKCGLFTFPESDVQCVPDKARLLEVKALALAYQATLTKQGKVMKSKLKGVAV